ncbi:flagellar hook-basal body complex protein FliE [Hyphomonas sp.]|uniref:flagellar hook-basal body complex protein FliE n=1 Tax=Hyphomonas sp. TaxID=87 RepID=UPI0025C26E1F|nr:flagellar hook-basal body complex protein FliE [Hyphomonas sp.]
MSGLEAIGAVSAAAGSAPAREAVTGPGVDLASAARSDFAAFMSAGLRGVEAKVETANSLVKQFAVDDTVPVHQVTIALEEARVAVELAVQVRARLVESYREIMNMQL